MAFFKIKKDSIWKIFLLYSLLSTLILVFAITIKQAFDKLSTKKNDQTDKTQEVENKTTWESILFTFLPTFIATFSAYAFMYWIFGYGDNLVVHTTKN
jgi:ABC-type spermidine/putrescine transport system permease subunit I